MQLRRRECTRHPTLTAKEGETVIKLIWTAEYQYVSYCLKDVIQSSRLMEVVLIMNLNLDYTKQPNTGTITLMN